MAKRSLKASPSGIQKAKQAFERREWTQEYLASIVGLQTRQSVWKFFTGRPIERYLFIDICFQLNLDWEEIADLPCFDQAQVETLKPDDILNSTCSSGSTTYSDQWDSTKKEIRQKLHSHYNALIQLRDLPDGVSLSDLYIERNIIGSYNYRRWLAVHDLHDELDYPQHADLREIPFRYSQALLQPESELETQLEEQSVAHELPLKEFLIKKRHIYLLGETGSGKSVTLQGLACQLNLADEVDLASCFLPVKSLDTITEDLEAAIVKVFRQQGFTELTMDFWQWLCQFGKVCLLFDGLSEIPLKNRTQLVKSIQNLVSRYPNILVIVSNRYSKSNHNLQGFHTATLAHFNNAQIQQFAYQWFHVVVASASIIPQTALNSAEPLSRQYANCFLNEIQQKKNCRLYKIAETPLLLHLLCIHFYFQQRLPKSRVRFYDYVLQTLLEQSGIGNTIRLESLPYISSSSDLIELLGQIAFTTFESGIYFFEKPKLIESISHYILQINQQNVQSEETHRLYHQANCLLDFLAEHQDVFIEIAQGVYTFSQPVFQEYLCATALAKILPPRKNNTVQSSYSFGQWIRPDMQARWHEVLYLILQLSPDPHLALLDLQDCMNIQIQTETREKDFLQWVNFRALRINQQFCTLPASVIRAIYFGVALDLGLDLAYMLHASLSFELPEELKQEMEVIRLISLIPRMVKMPDRSVAIDLMSKLQLVGSSNYPSSFQLAMQTLQSKITQSSLDEWPETEREIWGQQVQDELLKRIEFIGEWIHRESDLIELENYYWTSIFFLKCEDEFNQINSAHRSISEKILCSSG